MILKFTIENWMSFLEPVSFTMIPTDDSNHNSRIHTKKKFGLRVLPVAAILGGNASGKSNFVKALDFAQNLIVEGNINGGLRQVKPFLLDTDCNGQPSRFKFELLLANKVYLYEFELTSSSVVMESLAEIGKNKKLGIYSIKNDKIRIKQNHKSEKMFKLLFKYRNKNQLFLTTIAQLSGIKMPVYYWFRDSLTVALPNSRMSTPYRLSNEMMMNTINDILATIDCGLRKVDIVDFTPSEEEQAYFDRILQTYPVACNLNNMTFAEKIDGKIVAKKLVAFHKPRQDEMVKFAMDQESDGTKRILDLLPAFVDLSQENSTRVVVIDEFEQSLHTKMVVKLIEAYLDNCSAESQTQLIFTTHNVQLMHRSILRCDEMWLADRDGSGNSTLYSIGDFKGVHKEKDIRESYLIGRFGGIPDMLLIGSQLLNYNDSVDEQ